MTEIVDRRKNARLAEEVESKIKYGKFDPDPEDTARGNTRVSQVRWPLGEEPYPDVPGTELDDGWVNYQLEVVEGAEHVDQRAILKGGPELRMPCMHCGQKLYAAADRAARDILEEGGFTFPEDFKFPSDVTIVACVCPSGHITQLRSDLVKGLIA